MLESKLYPLNVGTLVIRDPRVIHGGTGNWSDETRFMPCLCASATKLLWESKFCKRTLPDAVWKTLDEKAQAHTEYVWVEAVDEESPTKRPCSVRFVQKISDGSGVPPMYMSQ